MTQLTDDQLIGPKIKVLNTLVEKELNNTLAPLSPTLTGTQVAVLMTLAERPVGTVTQKQMETLLHLSHPTTRGVIKRLAGMNLLYTTKSAVDQRQVVLQLTATGRQFVATNQGRINQATQKVERQLTSRLSPAEQEQFRQLLQKMTASF